MISQYWLIFVVWSFIMEEKYFNIDNGTVLKSYDGINYMDLDIYPNVFLIREGNLLKDAKNNKEKYRIDSNNVYSLEKAKVIWRKI